VPVHAVYSLSRRRRLFGDAGLLAAVRMAVEDDFIVQWGRQARTLAGSRLSDPIRRLTTNYATCVRAGVATERQLSC
jgi:hypothetical protein